MVTRTVVCVSASEAAKLAAEASSSSAEADSIIKNASTPTNNDGNNEERSDSDNNELERYVELQVGFRTIRVQQRGVIRPTTSTLAQPTPTNSTNNSNNKNNDGGARSTSEDIVIGNETKRHQRAAGFEIYLSDVPPQLPVPKSAGRIKEGSSKYTGVHFNEASNKWEAQIVIEGKQRHIGCYENEEEAAIDYARAVFKYKGETALDKAREQKSSAISIDLSDVPPQLPILKRAGQVKEGTSKYVGVYFHKENHYWRARITIEGKLRNIGCYENEEEAAIDYARAVFKYRGEEAFDKARERNSSGSGDEKYPHPKFVLDLSDVPTQQPIPKSKGRIKEGSSKYTGVYFNKALNTWLAQIVIDGKKRYIGSYESEEEAAIDYARAKFKYKREE